MIYHQWREHFVTMAPDKYPPEWIDKQVWTGAYRAWGNDKACILAEMKTYPSGLREVHGLAAAGDLETIISLIPLAEAWGRDAGCAIASIESRPGWAKALKDYRVDQVRLVKELN
jgi:hypothetical protein